MSIMSYISNQLLEICFRFMRNVGNSGVGYNSYEEVTGIDTYDF